MNGVIYYRLKQVDRDGKFMYAKVLTIRKNGISTETVQAFPNPATANNINLKIELNTKKNVSVPVTAMSGAMVYKTAIEKLLAGNNLLSVTTARPLNKGTYIIELVSEADKNILGKNKIVIQ